MAQLLGLSGVTLIDQGGFNSLQVTYPWAGGTGWLQINQAAAGDATIQFTSEVESTNVAAGGMYKFEAPACTIGIVGQVTIGNGGSIGVVG
jgi:hypothetical protein